MKLHDETRAQERARESMVDATDRKARPSRHGWTDRIASELRNSGVLLDVEYGEAEDDDDCHPCNKWA